MNYGKYSEVVSAGFVHLDEKSAQCFGKSVSLKLEPGEFDTSDLQFMISQ